MSSYCFEGEVIGVGYQTADAKTADIENLVLHIQPAMEYRAGTGEHQVAAFISTEAQSGSSTCKREMFGISYHDYVQVELPATLTGKIPFSRLVRIKLTMEDIGNGDCSVFSDTYSDALKKKDKDKLSLKFTLKELFVAL